MTITNYVCHFFMSLFHFFSLTWSKNALQMSLTSKTSCFPDGHRLALDLLLKCGKATVVGIGFISSLEVADVASSPRTVTTTFLNTVLAAYMGTPSPPATLVTSSSSSTEESIPYLRKYVKTIMKEGTGLWWVPVATPEWTRRAGMMGSSLLPHVDMLRMYALFFPQMIVSSGWRCLQHHFGIGAWKPTRSDNHRTYLAITNTSLATYYNNGAFVFYNCSFHSHGMRHRTTFKTIRVVCDHEQGMVKYIELILAEGQTLCGTAKPFTSTEERDEGCLAYIVDDPDEIGTLVVQLCAVVSHPHIHWWANGVSEVTQWPLHKKSNLWVQFLNYASIFQSFFFYHASFENNAEIITSNFFEGMPSHNHIPEEVTKWSVTHKMASEARAQISAHFKSAGTPINDSALNSLLCATIYHSADHHYLNLYTGVGGISAALKADFRALRICLVAGYRWVGFKLLCKQYYDEDPVCRILYDIAMKYDPELAEGILTMTISV